MQACGLHPAAAGHTAAVPAALLHLGPLISVVWQQSPAGMLAPGHVPCNLLHCMHPPSAFWQLAGSHHPAGEVTLGPPPMIVYNIVMQDAQTRPLV